MAVLSTGMSNKEECTFSGIIQLKGINRLGKMQNRSPKGGLYRDLGLFVMGIVGLVGGFGGLG